MSDQPKQPPYQTFTSEEIARVAEVVEEKTGGAKCPMCRGHSFTAASLFIMQGMERMAPSNTLNAVTTPTLRLFCENCGHVLMFSSVLLGLTDNQGNVTITNQKTTETKKPHLTLIRCDSEEPPSTS